MPVRIDIFSIYFFALSVYLVLKQAYNLRLMDSSAFLCQNKLV